MVIQLNTPFPIMFLFLQRSPARSRPEAVSRILSRAVVLGLAEIPGDISIAKRKTSAFKISLYSRSDLLERNHNSSSSPPKTKANEKKGGKDLPVLNHTLNLLPHRQKHQNQPIHDQHGPEDG
jgi:hypothetical protein